jgi:signal transduction histidine kinase
MIDRIPHIVWSVTADGHVACFNSAWQRLTGSGVGADLQAAMLQRIFPDDRERWCDRWRTTLKTGESVDVEYRMQSETQDAPRWYLERATAVTNGDSPEPQTWIVTATLIDDDRVREEELRGRLHEQDQFFATLLHELRNPLAPIANALDLLGAGSSDPLVVNVARGIIQRQLRQLTRLVDDLFDVSRVARGSLELQRRLIDLSDIVVTAVEAARPLMKVRGHAFTLGSPPEPIALEADPVRLGQILTNLLINAAKYTPAGGHISLSTYTDSESVFVQIRDDGIGIAADKLSRIFELFAQAAPGSVASAAGLGVGLAVAKQLVELHGGEISVRSEGLGRGSEFTVRLPLRAQGSA